MVNVRGLYDVLYDLLWLWLVGRMVCYIVYYIGCWVRCMVSVVFEWFVMFRDHSSQAFEHLRPLRGTNCLTASAVIVAASLRRSTPSMFMMMKTEIASNVLHGFDGYVGLKLFGAG